MRLKVALALSEQTMPSGSTVPIGKFDRRPDVIITPTGELARQ